MFHRVHRRLSNGRFQLLQPICRQTDILHNFSHLHHRQPLIAQGRRHFKHNALARLCRWLVALKHHKRHIILLLPARPRKTSQLL